MEESRKFDEACVESPERLDFKKTASGSGGEVAESEDGETVSGEQTEAPRVKMVSFGAGSAEFEEALEKIPPKLLELLNSQFGSKPEAFVKNGISPQKLSDSPDGAKTLIEDQTTIETLEEEDGE